MSTTGRERCDMTRRPALRSHAVLAVLALLLASAAAADGRVRNGGSRADTLLGTPRADVLRGFAGPDVLVGGRGPDRLVGGAGRDRLIGGPGDDDLRARDGVRDVVSCGPGRDRAVVDARDRVARDCEVVRGRPAARRPAPPPAPSPPAPPPPTAPGGGATRTFDGVLVTTIQHLSFCGPGGRTETTQVPSRVTVRPPLANTPEQPGFPAPVGADPNPVNIVLGQTTAAGSIAPGAVLVSSAVRFRATSPGLILRYWSLALAGTALTGTLVEDNREQAAAANLLSATADLVPCMPQFGSFPNQEPIAEGATLTGTLTATEVRLRITGNTVNTLRPFTAEIVAVRAG